jgi:hypothetical protein
MFQGSVFFLDMHLQVDYIPPPKQGEIAAGQGFLNKNSNNLGCL